MLIGYESEEKKLDTDLLDVKMKDEGISNIRIEAKPLVGRIYNVEVYFNWDIPIPQPLATKMMQGQKILQEIRRDDKWIDVRKTFPTICQAENCKNRSEQVAIFKKDGTMKMHHLCNTHKNLLDRGIAFNVTEEDLV
jgi:hypothetical protein